MNDRVLSLLGLALRGGRLAAGEEPAALAAKANQARLILAASDASGNALRRAEHLAQEGHCLFLVLPHSKAELGGALGRANVALAALTDLGLAAAVAERLALLDPERYGEAAARMDLKRRRAKERAAAPDPGKGPPSPRKRASPQGRTGRGRKVPSQGRGTEVRRTGPPIRRQTGREPFPDRETGTPRPSGPRQGPSAPAGNRTQAPLRPGQGRGALRCRPGIQGLGRPLLYMIFLRSRVRLKAGGGFRRFSNGLTEGNRTRCFIWLLKNTESTRWRRTSASPPRPLRRS
nr:hypothetical protein [uncultured Oscillibacter sp.]